MNFHNDEYTLDIKLLGYEQQANRIRDLILGATTPYAIGISGRWGSGKTSMMKYLMASLGGKPLKQRLPYQTDFVEDLGEADGFLSVFKKKFKKNEQDRTSRVQCIWFNPWEHERHQEPMVELLKEIRNRFSLLAKGGREFRKIASVTVQSGLDLITSFLTRGEGLPAKVQKIGEDYEQQNFEYQERNQRFKLLFQKAVEKLLAQKEDESPLPDTARLVIFIDDLDRCEEAVIAKLLREIKQYLATKHCVFVFGYDKHHVEKALAKSDSRSARDARAYLEKLFQSTIYLRQPAPEKVLAFIGEHLGKAPFAGQECFIPEGQRPDLAKFLTEILDPNPRRIKAFLTAFFLHVSTSPLLEVLAEVADQGTKATLEARGKAKADIEKLALIAYLKLFYEPVYAALENMPVLVTDLIEALKAPNLKSVTNNRAFFMHLELRSHLHDLSMTFEDKDIEILRGQGPAVEGKFLDEVYQMQGKHSSFQKFGKAFEAHFSRFKRQTPDEPEPITLASAEAFSIYL